MPARGEKEFRPTPIIAFLPAWILLTAGAGISSLYFHTARAARSQ